MKLNWNNLLQFITHLSAPFIINPKYSAPFPKFSPLHSPWFQASSPLVVSAPSSSMGKVMSCTRVGTDKPIFIKPSCTCAATRLGFFGSDHLGNQNSWSERGPNVHLSKIFSNQLSCIMLAIVWETLGSSLTPFFNREASQLRGEK